LGAIFFSKFYKKLAVFLKTSKMLKISIFSVFHILGDFWCFWWNLAFWRFLGIPQKQKKPHFFVKKGVFSHIRDDFMIYKNTTFFVIRAKIVWSTIFAMYHFLSTKNCTEGNFLILRNVKFKITTHKKISPTNFFELKFSQENFDAKKFVSRNF